MEYLDQLDMLDTSGTPLSTRIAGVLRRLKPRFHRQFSAIQDEVAQVEVFEEAGRRLTRRENHGGPIEKLNGYAWVTLRSVAQSYLRRGSSRLLQRTLDSDVADTIVSSLQTDSVTPEQIERGILLRELQEQLAPDEQFVWVCKLRGYSSREIAAFQLSTVTAVDTLFCRAKRKLRDATRVQRVEGRPAAPTRERTTLSLCDTEDNDTAHGAPPPQQQPATARR